MHTKSAQIGRPERHTPPNSVLWVTQVIVIFATLALLAIAYGVWHIFNTEARIPLPPDTVLPMPSPGP